MTDAMPIDTKGLTRDVEGKKLRLFFDGGEICEVVLLTVNVHENCSFGDDYADFYYDVISSNRPDRYKDARKTPKPVYTAEFKHLNRWELLDSNGER
ncbi:MAG TPA: hypothetical protein VMV59_10290 [Candidatus Dormibacteraeota bacterium]|nr:hypothetical protein [Candidatus Dormibacteraeota bacterium]